MILYETLNQPYLLAKLILVGFLCGFIFDIGGFVHFLCNKNKIVRSFLDFICTILCFVIFFLLLQTQSYGEFRIYILIVFIFSILIEQITIGKLLAKTYIWCYNAFRKLGKLFTKTREKFNGKNHKEN